MIAKCCQFKFESYSRQRNRALSELPIDTAWTLFLDADEWLPAKLKTEITQVLNAESPQCGFFLRRRFYWWNTWIRRGYYPVWILRLFRSGKGRCEDREVNEHILVDGASGYLQNDFIHQDRKPLTEWIEKHNRYALKEAQALLRAVNGRDTLPASFSGPQAARMRWLRERVYNRLPPIVRPFLFFFYRVVFRGGALDGWRAVAYHFLQAFWYPLLIDLHFWSWYRSPPLLACPVFRTHEDSLADNFPPERNAQASLVFERALYWAKWGHDVTVLTCAPNFPEGKVYPGYSNRCRQVEQLSGIRIVRIKTFIAANSGRILRILDYLSFMLAAVLAGLFEQRPDVIVATSPQFFAAVGGWVLSSWRRLPFVMEVRDLWPDSIVAVGAMKKSFAIRYLEKLELLLYRRAAAVVVLTPSFRTNLLKRQVPDEKIHCILSGVDLARYSPVRRDPALANEWGIGPNDFVIGYVGTFGMAHGLQNVLDAAALIPHSQVRFILVGTGQERENLLTELGRRRLENVTIIPAQTKEKIRDFWGLCDISLVHLRNTPLFETVIPSKIFESMGMGLPVLLAAPAGEASGIVEGEDMGIWVPAENPRALAAAALTLRENRALRERFAQNSLAAAPRYSREEKSKEMLAVLESICPVSAVTRQPIEAEPETNGMAASLRALSQQLDAAGRGAKVDVEIREHQAR